MPKEMKTYLGKKVYVAMNGFGDIVITREEKRGQHLQVTDRLEMDREQLSTLQSWVTMAAHDMARERDPGGRYAPT